MIWSAQSSNLAKIMKSGSFGIYCILQYLKILPPIIGFDPEKFPLLVSNNYFTYCILSTGYPETNSESVAFKTISTNLTDCHMSANKNV